MIRVAARTKNGLLTHITAQGHAGRQAEHDSIPCAVISVLLKGLGLSLADSRHCRVEGSVEQAGSFDMSITDAEPVWLAGLWSVTRQILNEAAHFWPEEVRLMVKETMEEKKDGT